MPKTTQADLDRLVEKWQKILRLQDWDIHASLVPAGELENKALAGCIVTPERRLAVIKLVDPAVAKSLDHDIPYCFESTLVHEIIHIYFELLEISEEKHMLEEQAVDSLARSLVKLSRGEFEGE